MGDEVTNLFRSASALLKKPELEDDDLDMSDDDEIVNLRALRPKKTKKPKTVHKSKKTSKRKTSSSTEPTENVESTTTAPQPTPAVVTLSDDDEDRAPEYLKMVEQQFQENKSARALQEKLRNTQQRLAEMQKTVATTSSRGSIEETYVPESKEICLTICPKDAEFSSKNFTVKMYRNDPFSKLMKTLQEKKNFSGEHRFLVDGVEVGMQKTPGDYYLGDRDELVLSKKPKRVLPPPKPVEIEEIDDLSPHSPIREPEEPTGESEPEASLPQPTPAPVAQEIIDDDEDFEIPVKKQKPAEEESGVKVKVNYGGQKKGFVIKKNDPMQKLIDAVSKHFGGKLKLKFDGSKVGETETAEELGLEDDDQLDAY